MSAMRMSGLANTGICRVDAVNGNQHCMKKISLKVYAFFEFYRSRLVIIRADVHNLDTKTLLL